RPAFAVLAYMRGVHPEGEALSSWGRARVSWRRPASGSRGSRWLLHVTLVPLWTAASRAARTPPTAGSIGARRRAKSRSGACEAGEIRPCRGVLGQRMQTGGDP